MTDIRSLALHALVARKLLRDPTILAKARRNLDRWEATAGERASWVGEWRAILDQDVDQIATFITSSNERATRLRQSSPFAGTLSEDERRRVFDAFR